MTPNIQYQSVPALDEAAHPTVTYIQGEYQVLTENPDTGRIMVSDGNYLVVNDNLTYGENGTGTTLTPDYANRTLNVVSSFKYTIKIPYKSI